MALLDDIRLAVRVSSTATDDEINMWIAAAEADMLRVGIRKELVEVESGEPSALVKAAITCYVKANYGYDVDERAQFGNSYRQIVCDLLNSEANASAGDTSV